MCKMDPNTGTQWNGLLLAWGTMQLSDALGRDLERFRVRSGGKLGISPQLFYLNLTQSYHEPLKP